MEAMQADAEIKGPCHSCAATGNRDMLNLLVRHGHEVLIPSACPSGHDAGQTLHDAEPHVSLVAGKILHEMEQVKLGTCRNLCLAES